MSALTSTSSKVRIPDSPGFGETALPILIGSLSGAGCGLLLWILAAVRFGVSGWF